MSGTFSTSVRKSCEGDGGPLPSTPTEYRCRVRRWHTMPRMTLPRGTRVGAYELTDSLGEGGMGEVYRARDARLGREVAVKVLAERFTSDESLRERFQREARAIAALSHPNILAIHDVGFDGARAYSVTELLKGETLRQRLSGAPMPARKALETAGQIADGLTAAHEHGIVHRDLKPENVFLTEDGRVKILDFGLARVEVSDTDRTLDMKTQPGTVIGTVGYMSPEQVRGLPADARSDIFSLGAVLSFRNLSADPENEYLSDAITEEIIGTLTRIDTLRVASRTSSFAFKGKEEDVRRIGERLGVKTVLEGSVRRAGSRIRVAAQLVDVTSGYHLWSEKYDRQMADVFDLQDELAGAIAETLEVRLLGAAETPLVAPATGDVEAYNHLLKGRYHFNRREPKSAIAEYERAIEIDPGCVSAYTGLADSFCVFGFYGGIDTRVAFRRARAAAEKARELRPGSPETHLSLALIDHYFAWDLGRLERECRAALSAAPRFAAAWSWLGLGFAARGRGAEGREAARQAARLETFSANV